jgi:hypothetical protein
MLFAKNKNSFTKLQHRKELKGEENGKMPFYK